MNLGFEAERERERYRLCWAWVRWKRARAGWLWGEYVKAIRCELSWQVLGIWDFVLWFQFEAHARVAHSIIGLFGHGLIARLYRLTHLDYS